jgi:tetratricopeptide (TPR) repeat protein
VKRLAIVAAVVALVAASAAGALYVHARREVTTSSREALRFYRQGRENELKMYERDAVASFAEALRHDPHFVLATVHLAGFLRQRDPERAKSLLECVGRFRDEITPREDLTFSIADAQVKGDFEKAATLAEQYAHQYPEDPEAYQFRANALARKGKAQEVVAEYQKLLSLNPNYATAYNSLGYYYAKQGEFAKGEDYLKRYRFLAPDQANPYDSLGELYANTGRYDEAEESLKKALAIKPDFFPSVAHLGTVAIGRGDFGGAAAQFLRAADLVDTPGMKVEFLASAAFLLASSGKEADARHALDRIDTEYAAAADVEKKLLTKTVRLNQAATLARLGDSEKAEAALHEAEAAVSAKSDFENGEKQHSSFTRDVAAVRGLLASAKGDYDSAAELLKSAISDETNPTGSFDYVPYQSFVRVALAGCLRQLGKHDEAEGTLKLVLARNPHFAPAVAEMARLKEAPSETVPRRS